MKVVILLSIVVGVALGRPQNQNVAAYKDAVITKYETQNDGTGNYRFAYDTSDGQSRDEEGEIMNAGTDDEFIAVKGSFSFVGQDGVTYKVEYIADQNGFRPVGDHLPSRRTPQLGIPPAALGSLVGGGIG